MFPSHHTPSHEITLRQWFIQHTLAAWHSVPDRFVTPLKAEKQFAFVCGCGHSGTTLVAAKLGNHADAFLIGKETNAFSIRCSAHCAKVAAEQWEYFANVHGKSLIVEKTPKHVHMLWKIRRVIPQAKIIVTVRNPLDNIASLFQRFGNLDRSIRRWLADNSEVPRFIRGNDFYVIKYERLTKSPQCVFRALSAYIGIPWTDNLLLPGVTGYNKIARYGNSAKRRDQVSRDISYNVGGWRQILTEAQAEYVISKTHKLGSRLGYEDDLRNVK